MQDRSDEMDCRKNSFNIKAQMGFNFRVRIIKFFWDLLAYTNSCNSNDHFQCKNKVIFTTSEFHVMNDFDTKYKLMLFLALCELLLALRWFA